MVARFPFTVTQLDELSTAYEAGESATSLARRYACSRTVIKGALKRRGIYDGGRSRAGAKWTSEQKAAIIVRYSAGASIYVLAAEYGCSPNGLWKFLRTNGVKMRFHGRLEGRKSSHGVYVRVQVDQADPIASAMGWVNGFALEHRIVMARSLGRPLEKHETVHHVNGDPTDNRLENLQLRKGPHGRGVRSVCLDCGSRNIGHADL
jgi:hypothetical protein